MTTSKEIRPEKGQGTPDTLLQGNTALYI